MKTSLKTVFLLAIPCIMIIGAVGVVSSQNSNKKSAPTNQTSSSSSQNSSISTDQMLEIISKKITLPEGETATIAKIGDKKNFATVQELQTANSIEAKIYKDAKDGDYTFVYSARLIVYRPSDEKIIYDGKSARMLLEDSKQEMVEYIITKAKQKQLIPNDYKLKPQVSVVTDPDAVKKVNPFYNLVEKDDFVAQFSEPNIVVIYRPATDTIVNSGTFNLQINLTK